MTLHRRAFLQATAVALSLPWWPVAEALVPAAEPEEAFAEFFRRPCTHYRLVVIDGDGRELWAPKTARVDVRYCKCGKHKGHLVIAESIQPDLEPPKHLAVHSVRLVSPQGEVLKPKSVLHNGEPLRIFQGDTMNLTYELWTGHCDGCA